MNKVILTGRTTKDIELKKTPSNMSVCTFNLAVNRPIKKEGQPDADFITCTAWGKTAEIIERYVAKGNRIGITGRIQTRSYESQHGKVFVTEVMVEDVEFLENKKEQERPTTTYTKDINTDDCFELNEEDLPF